MLILAVLVCSMARVVADLDRYARPAVVAHEEISPRYDATPWIDEKFPPDDMPRELSRFPAQDALYRVRVREAAGYPRRWSIRQVYG